MFSLPILYGLAIFAARVGSNVIRSPAQPSLTFQVEPDDTTPNYDSSVSWSGDTSSSSSDAPSDHEFGAAFKPFQPFPASFMRPFGPPAVASPYFLPVPFVNLFQNAVARILSFSGASSPLLNFHHLPDPIDCSQYTIGQVLDWTLLHTPKPSGEGSHHPPPLHRLAWLVNISHPVRDALHNPDADFTLFAPDDQALTPPWKKKHGSGSNQFDDADEASQEAQIADDDAQRFFWDALEFAAHDSGCPHMRQHEENDGDEEKKKKFFLHAIELVLKYHISPGRKTLREIVDSSTLPTELPILPNSEAPRFRVRVGRPSPIHLLHHGRLTLNFFSKFDAFKTRPIIAKNGIIYIIERSPLIPPLSPLSQLFLFPRATSTLTSALQKTHLDDLLLPRWENKTIPLSADSSVVQSSSFDTSLDAVDERVQSVISSLLDSHGDKLKKDSFTVFVPTNRAFDLLGREANVFLFSPFGQHILRYVLSYHIVPDLIWNTDHCDRTNKGHTTECDLDSEKTYQMDEPFHPLEQLSVRNRYANLNYPLHPHPGKVNITKLSLPTLLGSRVNESLPISLVEFRPFGEGPLTRRVYITPRKEGSNSESHEKHAIPVVVSDGIAWGGALHVVPNVIHPPAPEGHHKREDVQRAIELSILTPA